MGAEVIKATARLAAWVLAVALVPAGGAFGQEAAGEWNGLLQVGGVELRIGVSIQAKPDGGLSGALTSPDQGPGGIPVQGIRVDDGVLRFAVPQIRGSYQGRWDPARNAWDGTWTQGAQLPLTLARGPVPARARPQVLQRPYPYREEEVAFESSPGVRLAGTLTMPTGAGPFPAAVLITGSGPQDRDEALLGHRPFLVLADHLTRQGIAVLRYDDRGFAKSTGDFSQAVSADFAIDAAAAVMFLRSRGEIDPRRVGLIGHSEGGMVAPMVAVKDPEIAFVVLLAGPGAPSRELMAAQRQAVGRVSGAPPEVVARREAVLGRIDNVLAENPDWEAAKVEATRLLGASAAEAGFSAEAAVERSRLLMTPWYRDFIGFDPRPNLRALRMPVLALNGANDLQVVAAANLPAIREALRHNPDAEVVELPGLNHLFQTSATGSPADYGRIEETFAPAALTRISEWVRLRVGN